MTKTYELIELFKRQEGIESDYRAAKAIGLSIQNVSDYKNKRNEAKGIKLLQIIVAAGMTAEDALNFMTKKADDQASTTGGNSASVYYVK